VTVRAAWQSKVGPGAEQDGVTPATPERVMPRKTQELDNPEAGSGALPPSDAPATEAANGKTARAPKRARSAVADPAAEQAVAERLERAEALAESGAHAEAAEAFAAIVTLRPDSVRALLGAGTALAAQGKYEAAEKELRRAEKLAPDDAAVHLQLGSALLKRGNYPAAATSLRRAVELDPDTGPAYVLLGEALNQMAESDAAIEVLETAVRIQPESSKAYYAMGIAYDRKGNHERAAEMYRLSREVASR
jgi:tetratricopeptide (TPR) repeat protein